MTEAMQRAGPVACRRDFLPAEDRAELLAWTIGQEGAFAATGVDYDKAPAGDALNRSSRALGPALFQPWRPRIAKRIAALLPGLYAEFGMAPVAGPRIELQLTSHNDGDFFRRHIDVGGDARSDSATRALSLVYYFHAEPKAFTGGALRMFAIADERVFTDVEPAQNMLVAFLPWSPHEVLPIHCPSRAFADSRFAINCWIHRASGAGQGDAPGAPPEP